MARQTLPTEVVLALVQGDLLLCEERKYLTGVTRLASERGVEVVPKLLDGAVDDALENYASQIHADLVVMTTHGRGALQRTRIGHVADQLLRDLPVPVLLMRPEADGSAQLDQSPAFNHVLIMLDGSAEAKAVLEPAEQLGCLWNARCTLSAAALPMNSPAQPPFPYYSAGRTSTRTNDGCFSSGIDPCCAWPQQAQ